MFLAAWRRSIKYRYDTSLSVVVFINSCVVVPSMGVSLCCVAGRIACIKGNISDVA